MSAQVKPFPVSAEAMSRLRILSLAGDVPIATLQRTELEVQDLLLPWSASCLIAQLAQATPAEREQILRQLEARR